MKDRTLRIVCDEGLMLEMLASQTTAINFKLINSQVEVNLSKLIQQKRTFSVCVGISKAISCISFAFQYVSTFKLRDNSLSQEIQQ